MKIHTFDNGIKVYQHHLLELQKARYLENNLHEPEEEVVFLDTIDQLPRNTSYINVGAAIGYYCILAKLRRPDLKVYAYEPLKIHRKRMLRNLTLNGFSRKDVTIYKEGIDTSQGFAQFHRQDFSSAINRTAPRQSNLKKLLARLNGSFIRTISLEQAINRCEADVGLVSMDIQGLELGVINASKAVIAKQQVRSFLVGTHGPGIHKDVVGILRQCGYTIRVNKFDTKLQPDGIVLADTNVDTQAVQSPVPLE